MSEQYAPVPWFVDTKDPEIVRNNAGLWIQCPGPDTAKRICACVNACKGMSTERLTKLVDSGGTIFHRGYGRTYLFLPIAHEPGLK